MRWHVYTDGAWEEPEENHDGPAPPAGFGVAEITVSAGQGVSSRNGVPIGQLTRNGEADSPGRGHVTWVCSAQVQIDPEGPDWMGATAHTNNTGELSALMIAVRHALLRTARTGAEIIHSDSLYAINMTTGKWRPRVKRNMDMIAQLRVMWRTLVRRRPGEVRSPSARALARADPRQRDSRLARGSGRGRDVHQRAARESVGRAAGARGGRDARCVHPTVRCNALW